MAKKKTATEPEAKLRGRPRALTPKQPTPIVMTVRANPAWQAWMDDLCEVLKRNSGLGIKIDRTDAFDVALRTLADKLGLAEPPPRY